MGAGFGSVLGDRRAFRAEVVWVFHNGGGGVARKDRRGTEIKIPVGLHPTGRLFEIGWPAVAYSILARSSFTLADLRKASTER